MRLNEFDKKKSDNIVPEWDGVLYGEEAELADSLFSKMEDILNSKPDLNIQKNEPE